MKKTGIRVWGVFFILALMGALSGLKAAESGPWVLGYYPSWETGVAPGQLNYKLFTHLCHAFIETDKDGNLKMEGNMPSADLTGRAHAVGTKVLLSLGWEGSGKRYFNSMSRKPQAVERFVDSVVEVLVKYHYDGVDMDWEFPETAQDRKNLSAMLALFREKLSKRAPGAVLTMALPASDWSGKWFDANALSSLVDFGNVMTYDFHGPWGSNGHNANLYPIARDKTDDSSSTVQGMDYWSRTRQWPARKLLVGIPCFGHGFVGEWYGSPREKTKYGDFHFKDSFQMVKEGWKKNWDAEGQVPYLSNKDESEFISYDDERSVGLKAQWAKKTGYPGIFFWDITEDFMNNDHVLVQAARKAYLTK